MRQTIQKKNRTKIFWPISANHIFFCPTDSFIAELLNLNDLVNKWFFPLNRRNHLNLVLKLFKRTFFAAISSLVRIQSILSDGHLTVLVCVLFSFRTWIQTYVPMEKSVRVICSRAHLSAELS